MNVIQAVLCESASVEANGRISTTGSMRQIVCPGFPHVQPRMWLVWQFEVPDARYGDKLHLRIERIDPDGRVLDRVLETELTATGGPDDLQLFPGSVELLNLKFDEPGDYQFSIFVDGGLARSVDLRLREMR